MKRSLSIAAGVLLLLSISFYSIYILIEIIRGGSPFSNFVIGIPTIILLALGILYLLIKPYNLKSTGWLKASAIVSIVGSAIVLLSILSVYSAEVLNLTGNSSLPIFWGVMIVYVFVFAPIEFIALVLYIINFFKNRAK